MASQIDYVADWKSRLRSRLYLQFSDKPNIIAWCDMQARQIQDLEDACQALLTIVSIDDSIGTQLDNLGRVIGQPRLGLSDSDYRGALKARIVANKSNGLPDDIYAVFKALLGSSISMALIPSPIRSFVLHLSTPITQAEASLALTFLQTSKEAGTRAILEWQQVPTSQLFTFGIGPGFGVGVFADASQA